METTISMPKAKWDLPTIRTITTTVKAKAGSTGSSSPVEAKAGHPILWDATGKSWQIQAASADLSAATGAMLILAEDATIETTGTTVKCIYAGVVYMNAIRDAGVDATKLPDDVIRQLGGRVIVLDREDR